MTQDMKGPHAKGAGGGEEGERRSGPRNTRKTERENESEGWPAKYAKDAKDGVGDESEGWPTEHTEYTEDGGGE
jgi:hypothetical protein